MLCTFPFFASQRAFGAASGCSARSPRDPRCRSRASGRASRGNNPRSVCFRCRWQHITGTLGAPPSCVRHPCLGTPISRARSSPTTTTITPTNSTINCNPNPNRGCWSRSRSRTSRWSRSGSTSGSGGASKSRWSREKRKCRNGGSSMSGHLRKRKDFKVD